MFCLSVFRLLTLDFALFLPSYLALLSSFSVKPAARLKPRLQLGRGKPPVSPAVGPVTPNVPVILCQGTLVLPDEPAAGGASASFEVANKQLADPKGKDAMVFEVKKEPQDKVPPKLVGARQVIHLAEESHQSYHEAMEDYFSSMRRQIDVSTASCGSSSPQLYGGIASVALLRHKALYLASHLTPRP